MPHAHTHSKNPYLPLIFSCLQGSFYSFLILYYVFFLKLHVCQLSAYLFKKRYEMVLICSYNQTSKYFKGLPKTICESGKYIVVHCILKFIKHLCLDTEHAQ